MDPISLAVLKKRLESSQEKEEDSEESKRQCFRDDKDSSFSGNRVLEEEKEGGFVNEDVRSKRKRMCSCGEDNYDLSSKHRCLESIQREEEEEEDAALKSSDPFLEEESDGVCIEPELKISQESKRKRTYIEAVKVKHSTISESPRQVEEDKFAHDAVFYKPWLDRERLKRRRLGDDEAPLSSSPSQEEVGALTLLKLSRDKWPTPIQTQMQLQSQTQTPKIDSYKCNVCGKEFSSSKALGYHKAIHSDKSKPVLTSPSEEIYKCSRCNKIFRTRQALGGHKRWQYRNECVKSRAERKGIDRY